MAEVHYGVVRQGGVWTIIGQGLKYGAYPDRPTAEDAARRLAELSGGLPVQLHVQIEGGELKPPSRVN